MRQKLGGYLFAMEGFSMCMVDVLGEFLRDSMLECLSIDLGVGDMLDVSQLVELAVRPFRCWEGAYPQEDHHRDCMLALYPLIAQLPLVYRDLQTH